MRRVLIVAAALVALFLLWGPIPVGGGGTLGGVGRSVTQWGVPGAVTVTTELSWYRVGDVPVSRSAEVSWVGLAASAALTAVLVWVGSRLWRRRNAEPAAAPDRRADGAS